jgi:hypothetical protein
VIIPGSAGYQGLSDLAVVFSVVVLKRTCCGD